MGGSSCMEWPLIGCSPMTSTRIDMDSDVDSEYWDETDVGESAGWSDCDGYLPHCGGYDGRDTVWEAVADLKSDEDIVLISKDEHLEGISDLFVFHRKAMTIENASKVIVHVR